jgi:SAM-dependent methyltransferase
MRELIRQFVRIVADTLPVSNPVYEFGSLQVPGQEGFADLRPFFPGKKYIGADMRAGPGVDLILNLHRIDLPAESAGTVLLFDTIEHVEFPRKAMEEIKRILRPDGMLIISSVMNFPIHEYPYDYWRFTPEAFRSLLQSFSSSFVDSCGISEFPHTVIGIGFNSSPPENILSEFQRNIDKWKDEWRFPQGETSRLKRFLPPIVVESYVRIRGKSQE